MDSIRAFLGGLVYLSPVLFFIWAASPDGFLVAITVRIFQAIWPIVVFGFVFIIGVNLLREIFGIRD